MARTALRNSVVNREDSQGVVYLIHEKSYNIQIHIDYRVVSCLVPIKICILVKQNSKLTQWSENLKWEKIF